MLLFLCVHEHIACDSQGWMNEIQGYDPETFQPSLTNSVYATLEGSRLRLAYPRASIPRRAAFDETPPEVVFVRSRTYQLANCKVSMPECVATKTHRCTSTHMHALTHIHTHA